MAQAEAKGVHVQVEFHKRWDPMYLDARARIRTLGDFSYYNSFMSQPKFQLEVRFSIISPDDLVSLYQTFRAWAGISSDISYYLNSHHMDFHVWALEGRKT